MKNVKKLLKKAMVFTLAASMLVGTPLTASAAGIRGVYSIQDGNGPAESGTGTVTNTDTGSGVLGDNDAKIIGIVLDRENVNAEKGKKETLNATIVLDGKITDKDGNDVTDKVREKLAAKIRWELSFADKSKDENPAAIVGIKTEFGNKTALEVNPKRGTEKGREVVITAKINSSYYVNDQGQVLEYVRPVGTYEASATVSVKEYTQKLTFDDPMPPAYLKHTLDLNDYITRTPVTANDEITWISDNTKIATVTAAGVVTFKKANASRNDNDELVVANEKDKCQIYAVGERGAKAVWEVKVEAGEQSSKIEIIDDQGNTFPGKKINDVDLRDAEWTKDVDVRMYKTMKVAVGEDGKTPAKTVAEADGGKKKDKYTVKNVAVADGDTYVVVEKVEGVEVAKEVGPLDITDTVTWSSNNKAIVSVDAKPGESGAVLTANGVGKAVITAKASSGKTDKLTVTVKATLKGLEIAVGVDDDDYILGTMASYSGKSYQLYARKDPAQSKDAVKWSIAKVEKRDKDGQVETDKNGNAKMIANPNATINAKGVLTIKPKLDLNYPDITVELKSAKELETGVIDAETNKPVKKVVVADPLIVSVEQSSLEAIHVKDDDGKLIADVSVINGKVKVNDKSVIPDKKDNTTEISVPKNRTYTAKVEVTKGYENEGNGLDTLTWTTSNAKIASVEPAEDGSAKITANANGTATITVSGVRVTTNAKGKVNASAIKTTFKVSVKQPVKTVTLNKPSVVLNEKVNNKKVTQNQKVALKATLGPKGVDKKTAVKWSVKKNGESLDAADVGLVNKKGAEITTANISVTLPTPKVGEVFEITASTDSGASATSTVTIVEKTTGVEIRNAETNALFEKENPKPGKDPIKNTAVMTIGDSIKMAPYINISADKKNPDWKAAGTDNCENIVSYTVNKKGIVNIDQSTGEVYAIKDGKVTITAKTALGKSAKLTVEVSK